MVLDVEGIQMSEFMKSFTGSNTVPPHGFPKELSVKFVHGCRHGCRCRPTVSTCDLAINIPMHLNSEEIMKEMLLSAVGDSQGFGNL